MSSPTLYKEVSESAYSMPKFNRLNEGEECEIVKINGDTLKLKRKDGFTFSQGPFIPVTFKSYGQTVSSGHGSTPRAIVVTSDGQEITQEDINKYASFYFVVKGGKTTTFSGGRKSRSRKSNKNKRTRRKSVKRLHRRK